MIKKKFKKIVVVLMAVSMLSALGSAVQVQAHSCPSPRPSTCQDVDKNSGHSTARTSSHLNTRQVRARGTAGVGSSGSVRGRTQYRIGIIIPTWRNDDTRTADPGRSFDFNSHRFANNHRWRLRLSRVSATRSVTATGRIDVH